MEKVYFPILKKLVTLIILSVFCGNSLFAQSYNELLGRPTNSSITNSILFDRQTEVYWEYGTTSGSYPSSTAVEFALMNTPLEFDFTNLLPDTKYYYRTRYRISGSATAFSIGPEHTFRTQRAQGSTFSFTIEADEHLYDKKGVRSLYKICLANQAADNPDFMLSLGDIFGDDHYPYTITSSQMDALHKDYRQYLGQICHSVPFYVCLGNHEGEFDYYLAQTPPNNIAVYGTLWRKFYYPNPYPNTFYNGNTDRESYGMGNPENYYSWTWGDALFVVLDAYRYQCDTSAKPQNWQWSLGSSQYTWLKNTLENSTARYKFVFAHHVRGQGRGGITNAKLFEWGGYEQNGTTYSFDKNRPGWAKPIHQLFVDNGVNIFFQGHDHLFAQEELDGVIYQEVPMPSDSTYEIGMLANSGAYVSNTLDGSGHLKVTVSPENVKVDYVRAYLPADTLTGIHHNREIAFSYSVNSSPATAMNEFMDSRSVKVYPNPTHDHINLILPDEINKFKVQIINTFGQVVLVSDKKSIDVSHLKYGIYLVKITSEKYTLSRKVFID